MNSEVKFNAGACAYPTAYADQGLTKRELFAAMAMQAIQTGILCDVDVLQATAETAARKGMETSHYISQSAVELADALLTELAKEPT